MSIPVSSRSTAYCRIRMANSMTRAETPTDMPMAQVRVQEDKILVQEWAALAMALAALVPDRATVKAAARTAPTALVTGRATAPGRAQEAQACDPCPVTAWDRCQDLADQEWASAPDHCHR